MQKREYTPSKASMILTSITNTQAQSSAHKAEYTRASQPQESSILKEYQALKAQVKQLEFQNRQLSTEAQRLRYQKNINENKYLQKVSFEEETIMQFQKEKNYQLELIKLKCEEESNRVRREFELKIDELQRELKNKDYTNREFNQKNSYLELKTNEIRRSVENLEMELIKYRQNSASLSDLVSQEQFKKKKLQMLTDELEHQKNQMESQIHILLDIEAQKSRQINSLQVRLRNSQATERSLQEKLANLNENFINLEHHISLMKERLLSADMSNDEGEKELRIAQQTLAMKDQTVASLKQQEIRLREDLQREQAREIRRQKELGQLISENDRLYQQLNAKKQRLHEMCISQGIQI